MSSYLPVTCPILWEELRRRLRGGRGFIALLVYTGLLVLILLVTTLADSANKSPEEWPEVGKTLWAVFYIGQLSLLTLISPSLTAGAISSEREHETLELLLLTRMGSFTIVLGKFIGAIGQMLLIVLAGLPVISVVFFFGGVSPRMMLEGYSLILVSGIGVAALGLFSSCLFKRMATAVGWAYGLTLLFLLGIPLLMVILSEVLYLPVGADALVFVNPFVCAFAQITAQYSYSSAPDVKVWPVELLTVGVSVLLLAESTMMVRRLRGLSRGFLPKRLPKPVRLSEQVKSDPAQTPVEAAHE